MSVTCVELFAGAGGSALGLERLELLEHVALVEQDPDACATLRKANLGPVVEADVREAVLPEADVLWASFPCQAWSTAGKRKGAADERNGWPWTVDAIDKVKPTWFVGENVRGLTLHRGDCERKGPPESCPACYFTCVILAELRARFAHVSWWLLDAADFGVPQHRKRVFVWAGPTAPTPPTATHGAGLFSQPYVSMGEALGLSSAERAIGGGSNPHGPGRGHERRYSDLTNRPCTTVSAVQIGNAGPWVIERSSGARDATVRDLNRPAPTILGPPSGGYDRLQIAGPLVCDSMRNTDEHPHRERPRPVTEPAPTIGGKGNQFIRPAHLPEDRRRLTVPELAVLQGFPQDHPFQGTKTSRYRQVGNAVPPALAEVVMRAVLRAGGE